MFKNVYADKTVLVTGHSGFKGSWLSLWLQHLGAKVVGYSAYRPSQPCNFDVCGLDEKLTDIKADVRDLSNFEAVLEKYNPDIVFHLASQALVRKSFREPKETFDTNVGGMVNILEGIRRHPGVKAAVLITSDKCYRNVEWTWGYREHDTLGGEDPYSASKGCAELVAYSYIHSYFQGQSATRIATARAGNVIGGGDWAEDRIVPDCMRAWSIGEQPLIRNPQSTRPWQHVLEPLSGYLWLGAELLTQGSAHGEAFNFGPSSSVTRSVHELLVALEASWRGVAWREGSVGDAAKESKLLKLCCDKALHELGWHASLNFEDTARFTCEWYRQFYAQRGDMLEFSNRQISAYVEAATKQDLSWTR